MTGFSSRDRDLRTLRDMLDFCEQAERLVARGREAYEGDEMLRLAAEALTHRVGRDSWRVSGDLQRGHPAVPRRAIEGMRNLVAHDYGRIDHGVVWNTLAREFPRLSHQLREIGAHLESAHT